MSTRRFALVGDPVAQSSSPRMHRAAYAALGLSCTYEAIRATESDLASVVSRLREGSLDGLNITIPHKRRILAYADIIDASARVVGAANTLARAPDGRLVAHNTDVPAIASELRSLGDDISAEAWTRARTLVLGTGATARAAVMALGYHLSVGEVTVRGRALAEPDEAAAFGAEMNDLLLQAGSRTVLRLEPWGPIVTTERQALAIVQATNVGMEGGDPGDLAARAVAWRAVLPRSIALDVVYAKAMTPFLEAGKDRGLRVADGRGMRGHASFLIEARAWTITSEVIA